MPTPPDPPPPTTTEPFRHTEEFKVRAMFKTRAELGQTMQRLRSPGGTSGGRSR